MNSSGHQSYLTSTPIDLLWISHDVPTAQMGSVIAIGLDLYHDWSKPYDPRYQHRFSTGSGNGEK